MAISVLPISAQEQRIKEPEKISFKPHWFIQAQIGAAHTVGEAKFTDLISPAAALNVGYKFAPAFGARVGVSGWQAKGNLSISTPLASVVVRILPGCPFRISSYFTSKPIIP